MPQLTPLTIRRLLYSVFHVILHQEQGCCELVLRLMGPWRQSLFDMYSYVCMFDNAFQDITFNVMPFRVCKVWNSVKKETIFKLQNWCVMLIDTWWVLLTIKIWAAYKYLRSSWYYAQVGPKMSYSRGSKSSREGLRKRAIELWRELKRKLKTKRAPKKKPKRALKRAPKRT